VQLYVRLLRFTQHPQRAEAVERRQAELTTLQERLNALETAIVDAEQAAQHRVAAAYQAEDLEDTKALLAAYEQVIAITARKHARRTQALQQFPESPYGQPRPYARDIKAGAGLPLDYDTDFLRLPRSVVWQVWDRYVLGGKVKAVYDALRQSLGLPEDKGEMTAEGAEALRLHQRQGLEAKAKREAAHREAIQAAKRRGDILPPYLRAS
jgi:hypothetical protein